MSSTTFRTYATATTAAALLGAASFLAPAIAAAQPLAPSDIIKIDSPELKVNVQGDTAHFTVGAPDGMACAGPIIVEGSIETADIAPENINEEFFEDLFDEAVWPTRDADLHVVVNKGSSLAGQPGVTVSPLNVSVSDLPDADYVAASLCLDEDEVPTYGADARVATFSDTQFPVQIHLRNFSMPGGGIFGSVDVFGSLGSTGS